MQRVLIVLEGLRTVHNDAGAEPRDQLAGVAVPALMHPGWPLLNL